MKDVFLRDCLILAFVLLAASDARLSADEPPAEPPITVPEPSDEDDSGDKPAAEAPPADKRPLILPPKTRPADVERSLADWVSLLNHPQYLRRELATKKLAEAGPQAVPYLVDILKQGDLETVERAMTAISGIALNQAPDNDGGAWKALTRLAERSSGVRATRARSAIDEIRVHRSKQARAALTGAGIFVGVDEYIIGSTSQPRMSVRIGESCLADLPVLQWLRWLEGVEFARVEGLAVRREVLQRLVEMPDLSTLTIVDGSVDRKTLEPLDAMSRIRSLEFRYVKLTPDLCDMIVKMPVRESLNLMGTGVATAKVADMQAALPGLKIDHKQGGFLGVNCIASLEVCQISGIVPNSAAEAAGLITGDVIVGIGDSEVGQFADLQNAINQHVPGDEVEVRYLRGEKLQRVKLQLRRLEDK